MSIHQVRGTEYSYYLVAHDKKGVERRESDGSLLSERVLRDVSGAPVTDIFIMSHGWRGDGPAAVAQYDAWSASLMTAAADIEEMKARRPGFRPMLIGWHWPSEPWGDEDAGSFEMNVAGSVAAVVDDY